MLQLLPALGLMFWPLLVCLLFRLAEKRKVEKAVKPADDTEYVKITKAEWERMKEFYTLAYNLGVDSLPVGVIAAKIDGATVVSGMDESTQRPHAPIYRKV
jgi:hypothetical protein